MQRLRLTALLVTTALLLTAQDAAAHDGRRFEVKVIDNQLFAHGYASDGSDDGAGAVREYYNTIHDHFENLTPTLALADLPGYDLLDGADALIGDDLVWTAVGFKKWSTPAVAGPIVLSELDGDEVIEVKLGATSVFSDNYLTETNSFTLIDSFNGTNGGDLDLSYRLHGDNPSGEIYVIESILSTTAPGIGDSEVVYTLLSPDGDTMMQRLHHPALYLESQLGTPVPEPISLCLLIGLLGLGSLRRRS